MQTRRAGVGGISRSAEFRSARLKFTIRSYGTWTLGRTVSTVPRSVHPPDQPAGHPLEVAIAK
eukprot:scaffold569611_cov36-Prasinocladus_malaysianus.AAC.1